MKYNYFHKRESVREEPQEDISSKGMILVVMSLVVKGVVVNPHCFVSTQYSKTTRNSPVNKAKFPLKVGQKL